MSATAASADAFVTGETVADLVTDTALWLPATALDCYEGHARLRSWLLTPGLLTQRMRETGRNAFQMRVLGEALQDGDHRREIELVCAGVVWVFAQTRVPAATLAAEPWLQHIGETALGEALAAQGRRVKRSDFEYAKLTADHEVVTKALTRARLGPQALWVRRSTFQIETRPLYLQEVFLPQVGDRTVGARP